MNENIIKAINLMQMMKRKIFAIQQFRSKNRIILDCNEMNEKGGGGGLWLMIMMYK